MAPDGAFAVSFLVAEGADTLLGFDALEWWNSLAADNADATRALFGARDAGSGEWLGWWRVKPIPDGWGMSGRRSSRAR